MIGTMQKNQSYIIFNHLFFFSNFSESLLYPFINFSGLIIYKYKSKMTFIETEQKVLVNTRAGGVYIPPARLRQMQQTITDKSSKEYQRITWEALKKSINGLINKVFLISLSFGLFDLLKLIEISQFLNLRSTLQI